MKKESRSQIIKDDDTRNYMENPNQKKSRNHTQIHYFTERLQGR